MRIRRIETNEFTNTNVRDSVAISILQEQHVRLLSDIRSTMTNFKSGWLVQAICKHSAFVRPAVTIIVCQNNDFVIEFTLWQPVWIRRHRGYPQTSFVIEVDCHGIGEFRKVLFRCNQLNFITIGHFEQHLLFGSRKVLKSSKCAPPAVWIVFAADIGLDFQKRKRVCVITLIRN